MEPNDILNQAMQALGKGIQPVSRAIQGIDLKKVLDTVNPPKQNILQNIAFGGISPIGQNIITKTASDIVQGNEPFPQLVQDFADMRSGKINQSDFQKKVTENPIMMALSSPAIKGPFLNKGVPYAMEDFDTQRDLINGKGGGSLEDIQRATEDMRKNIERQLTPDEISKLPYDKQVELAGQRTNTELSGAQTSGPPIKVPDVTKGRLYDVVKQAKNLSVDDYLKKRIPEIEKIDGNFIYTKDGNKIELAMNRFSDGLQINGIQAEKKGTGIGGKIVEALQEWTTSRYGTISIDKAYNRGFWNKMGFTGYDEYNQRWGAGDKIYHPKSNVAQPPVSDVKR